MIAATMQDQTVGQFHKALARQREEALKAERWCLLDIMGSRPGNPVWWKLDGYGTTSNINEAGKFPFRRFPEGDQRCNQVTMAVPAEMVQFVTITP